MSKSTGKQWIPLVLGLSIVAGAAAYGVQRWQHGQNFVSTDDAQVEGVIIPIRARVSGLVERVPVEDNQAVAAGTELVQLRELEATERLREAEADYASLLFAAGKGGKPGLLDSQVRAALANTTASRASIEQLMASLSLARAELDRVSRLAAQRMATAESVDSARTRVETLEHAVAAARSTSQAAHEGALAQQAQLRTQDFRIDAAKARLAIARVQLEDTCLVAPRAGVVSRKTVEPGQFIVAGQQLMTLTDTAKVWVQANLKETDVGRVKPGQAVRIGIDAYPGRDFEGVVDSIVAATGSKFSLLPQENATGNFTKVVQRVPVKITLKPPAGTPQPPLRPGMSAVVEIRTNTAG